jgi:hypothetical protein
MTRLLNSWNCGGLVNHWLPNSVAERRQLQENTKVLEPKLQLLQQNIIRMVTIGRAHSLRAK